MKNRVFAFMVALKYVICLPIAIGITSSIQASGQDSPPMTSDVLEEKLENLPLLFRQNMGQWDEKILYSGSSHSANVYFMKNELSFGFIRPVKKEMEEAEPVMAAGKSASELQAFAARKFKNERKTPEYERLVWNVRFQGVNPNTSVVARGKADSKTNYFIGNDPRKHCANVPDYKILTYKNIYDNIDLKYYGTNNRLKYDFVLKPNAKVADIKMIYAGIKNIRINSEGELLLTTAWGEMKEEKPFTYQLVNGRRTEIMSSYVLLNDSTVGFKMLEEYSMDQELIIDPIVLDWATFTGGTMSVKYGLTGQISKVAVDAAGNVYAVGSYASTFPTTPGSYDPTFGGGTGYDAIVFKLNSTGTAFIYSTYMGGNQWDSGSNIYLEASGDVLITGQTSSANWPVLNAYDPSYNGGGDIFVTKLNAAGSALVFSTFLGGTGSDMGADITLDATGNIYVAGNTSSLNFPVSAGAFQTALKGSSDIIVSKLNPTASALIYSALMGSSKNEYGIGIGVNAAGEATVGGNSDSTDFPTTPGAYDQTYNDAPNIYNLKGDMVVFKLNATATGLIFSTYLGGNIGDSMQGMHVSPNDEAFVCGVILFSNNFPITPGVIGPTTANGTFDSFVTRFNSTGTALIYSTYLGNADPSSDEARDIWVNAANEAYVTGDGGSFATFPVTTGPCATCTGGEDIYACKLNATATCYLWSTFIGSKDWDVCQAIGVYAGATQEDIALGFGSNSFVFPTTAGVLQQNKPTTDSTNTIPGIVKYIATPGGTANAGPDVTICPGAMVTLTGSGGSSSYLWSPGGQTTSSIVVSPTTTTSYTLSVGSTCGGSDSVKVTVNSAIAAAIAGNTSICAGQTATLTASGGGNYLWTTGATTAVVTVTATSAATYSVIVSSGSCPDDTAVVTLTVNNPPSPSIAGNTALCNGQSSTLTASGGGTYAWSNGSTATALVISPTSNTAYTVTVSIGGCTAMATQSVSVSPLITVAASSTQAGCVVNNGTATANAGGGTSPFTYSWSNGQLSSAATGLSAGNYTVTITDAGGCTKTQTVSVASSSNLNATAAATQTGCSAANGTASANATAGTAPYTYSWSNGQTTQTASGLATGSYTAIITDASGCTTSAVATVTSAAGPTATATATATFVSLGSNSSLSSTGGGTYQWTPSTGLSCTTCANPTATPDETTEYCVIVTDANGCSDSACITIVVDVPCGNIYIPNAFSPNDDLENDLECVIGPCIQTLHLIIFNRWGEQVFESRDQKICWDGMHKGNRLDAAVFSYYLEATMTNGTMVFKQGNISLIR